MFGSDGNIRVKLGNTQINSNGSVDLNLGGSDVLQLGGSSSNPNGSFLGIG